ncbi:probable LRR receptor-like serine threonine-kinase At4g08850 isoform X2, putative [Babesia ovata]|uniref:Probable LRR receptor-like serine threonine-kinase At4g08850 isoform X2, putative n=1 Tax=Babesia ovata TaxID=189622 RepID=A0A2H6KAB8_9APIC|nr:probable LRR receptor-like serine threonine-kinase At4g08850 isoform X2, putative [Babesia ovata]GBE59936.1 probable LRR receptor-like serine threonine-kinase At4g08850 isoform X2, putative [Babesia ovata]
MGDRKERCLSSVSDTVNCLFSSCIPTVEREEVRFAFLSTTNVNQAPSSYTGLHDAAYRKEELKQLVGIFASRAQKYLTCTRVDLDKSEFKKARYKLDCKLQTLRVESDEAPVEIPLSKVKAVYGFEDLQLLDSYASFLNQEIIQNLGQEERDRLSVLVVICNSTPAFRAVHHRKRGGRPARPHGA